MRTPTNQVPFIFIVYNSQGECVVPWLEDTLILLNNILQLCQHFENKVSDFMSSLLP